MKSLFARLTLFLLLGFLPTAAFGEAEDTFRFIVLPDTQIYSQRFPHIFNAQTQWIKDNKEALNIKFVFHEGDLVNKRTLQEWVNAKNAMSLLDGEVPYALAIGNHDYDAGSTSTRKSDTFNSIFPLSRYQDLPTFGGVFEAGKMDNTYHLVEAGGLDWLILALEYKPRQEVVDWINEVADQYPDHKIIVVTHSHINPVGHVDFGTMDLWWDFLHLRKNVIFTFNGHYSSFFKIEQGSRATRQGIGKDGHRVYQMLSNYQTMSKGGSGYLRIITITPSENLVDVSTYSPHLDQLIPNPLDHFSFELVPTVQYTDNFSHGNLEGWDADHHFWQVRHGELSPKKSNRWVLPEVEIEGGRNHLHEGPLPATVDVEGSSAWDNYLFAATMNSFDSALCAEADVDGDNVVTNDDIQALIIEQLEDPLAILPGSGEGLTLLDISEVTAECLNRAVFGKAGMLFRYQDEDNHYRFEIDRYTNTMSLVRRKSAEEEVLASVVDERAQIPTLRGYVQATDQAIDIVLNEDGDGFFGGNSVFGQFGGRINDRKIIWNGIPMVIEIFGQRIVINMPTVEDTMIPDGSVGVYVDENPNTTFDDVLVEKRDGDSTDLF